MTLAQDKCDDDQKERDDVAEIRREDIQLVGEALRGTYSGNVWRGSWNGKPVVVKPVQMNEVAAIRQCTCKNVVRLLGVTMLGGRMNGVFEGLPRDLRTCIQQGMSERRLVKMARDIARGLAEVHRNGYLHRDIKPANVFCTEEDECVLGDFGFAIMLLPDGTLPVNARGCGSVPYLAPEYFCRGKLTKAIDIFAFGMVLIEMLNGRKPFSEICPCNMKLGMYRRFIDSNLVPNICPKIKVSPSLIELAASCVRYAPEARPTLNDIENTLVGIEASPCP